MRALSIKQPWAWLICAGHKDIENRNWMFSMLPYSANNPDVKAARIYVHAGKTSDVETIGNGCDNELWILERLTNYQREGYYNAAFNRGAIIGEVDITGCVTASASPWFEGPYGFVLANPVFYDKPIPYRGRLGFFEVTL